MTAIKPPSFFYCLYLIGLLLLSAPLAAQQFQSDSAFYQAVTTRHLENYQIRIGPDARLYNGEEYIRPGQGIKGNAFFLSDTLVSGDLRYEDAFFSHIGLLYDLVSDDLIIKDYSHNAYIRLVKQKLRGFSLLHHDFLWLPSEKGTMPFPKAGFYEQLQGNYEDTVALYGRHEKKVSIPAKAEEQPKYIQSDSYFIKLDKEFYQVDNLHSLLTILNDKKDSLKKYIAETHLDFKHNFERSLIKIISYYAQLRP